MTPRVVVFTDLDDTLFRTARKLRDGESTGAVQVATALNGQHGLMTPAQAALLDWIDPARAVPVTARGSVAFGRVALNFGGSAIVANGAAILNAAGVPDAEWQARVMAALAPHRAALEALPDGARAAAARIGAQVRTWLVEEPRCGGVYAVVKVEPGTCESALAAIAATLEAGLEAGPEGPWRRHLNGNNLALLPPGISKAVATGFMLARLRETGPLLAIGVGDSCSDLGFMQLCDFWMTPAGSQLDRAVAKLAT